MDSPQPFYLGLALLSRTDEHDYWRENTNTKNLKPVGLNSYTIQIYSTRD